MNAQMFSFDENQIWTAIDLECEALDIVGPMRTRAESTCADLFIVICHKHRRGPDFNGVRKDITAK